MVEEHESQVVNTINHKRAGLEQQMIQVRQAIVRINKAIQAIDQKVAGVLGEFRNLANIHNLENRYLSGHEDFTWVHEGQTTKARHYLIFSLCAGLVAIVFGVYFSFLSLYAESQTALLFGAIVMAAVLGVIANGVLWSSIGAHPEKPNAERQVRFWVWATGLVLLVSLAIFGWSRFVRHSMSEVSMAALFVTLELSAIMLAGAFACGYGIFSWSKKLDKKFRALGDERDELETEMAEKTVLNQELQYRLDRLDSKPIEERSEVAL